MSAFFALTETLLWENRHSNRLSQKGGILGSQPSQPLKRKHLTTQMSEVGFPANTATCRISSQLFTAR
jgi:hypothetical protein